MNSDLIELKKQIVTAAHHGKEGHIPSAFSILDILWVLYDKVMSTDPKNPRAETRDRFILSKGHASLGIYAVLSRKGFFDKSEFEKFGQYESILGGHPDRNKVPGVEASTGSLGHGLPMGVGMAMGLKIKKAPQQVFVMVGDGEANEGSIWESAMLGAHHKLDNLTCIIDYNHSTDRALQMGSISEKFKSFGWDVAEIEGHDHKQIEAALTKKTPGIPKAIIANTIKGYGCAVMESNPGWHHKSPNADELKEILGSLK